MFIVAAAFIAGFLMSEVWNLIRTRKGSSRQNISPGTVGHIGEHKIGVDEYRQVRQFIANKYHRDSLFRELTNEDEVKIEHLTWDYLAGELTWAKIFKETKLEITEGELQWIVTNFPPQQLLNHPDLMTDGKFDTNKYRQTLSNPQNQPFFAQYTRDIYEQLRMQKLQTYIGGALLTPDNEVKEILSLANVVVSVTGVYISANTLSGEERNYEPTESEVRAFYQQHRGDYIAKEEARELQWVHFPLMITLQDSQFAQMQIEDAYRRLVAAGPVSLNDSFELVSLSLSDYEPDTVSIPCLKGQNLPVVDSAVRRLRPGQFTKPLFTGNGWQIILLDSVRNDTFWVRRIRTRIKSDVNREMVILEQVRQFIEQASNIGFDSAAAQMNLMLGRPTAFVLSKKKLVWPVKIYNPSQLISWSATAKVGEVTDVPLRGPAGFYVFKFANLIRQNEPAPFDRVKAGVKHRVKQEKEKILWREKAKIAADQIKAGKRLEEFAAENPGVEIFHEEINGIFDIMAKGRRGPEYVGLVLALEPGQTVGPMEIGWGSYIVRCNVKRPKEVASITWEKYVQEKHQRLFQELWDKITEQPETRDWRFVRSY